MSAVLSKELFFLILMTTYGCVYWFYCRTGVQLTIFLQHVYLHIRWYTQFMLSKAGIGKTLRLVD